MITTAELIKKPSQLSAVRLPNSATVHAGSLAARELWPDQDTAHYVPRCNAGQRETDTGRRVPTGTATGDRITCGNCHRGAKSAVDAIHAQQDQASANGWQAVVVDEPPVCDSTRLVHTVHGVTAGTLSYDSASGMWSAGRIGYPVPEWHATAAQALAAVDWLASRVAYAFPALVAGTQVVLSDGTLATVKHVTATLAGFITFTVEPFGRMELAAPRPLGAGLVGLSTEVTRSRHLLADDGISFTFTVTPRTRIALTPACPECETTAGQECEIGHVFAECHEYSL